MLEIGSVQATPEPIAAINQGVLVIDEQSGTTSRLDSVAMEMISNGPTFASGAVWFMWEQYRRRCRKGDAKEG